MTLATLLAATKSSGSSIFPLILIAVFGIVYFFFIRPKQQAQKKARQSGREVEVGDQVVTVGGVHGTVKSVGDDHVVIATGQLPDATPSSDGSPTNLTFVKAAIARKIEPAVETPPLSSGEDETPEAGSTREDGDPSA